jgi:hypothetical protein
MPEYIHVQEGENIQRAPWRNIIIKKTPPSNSWWINNTEFEEVKLMMSTSLSLREEIVIRS